MTEYSRRGSASLWNSDEIVDIFSDGPRVETTELRQVLSKIFPSLDPKWREIKI